MGFDRIEVAERYPAAPRDQLAWFAERMERRLRNNDHKIGWDGMSEGSLLRRVGDELGELRRALKRGKNVVEEAADAANFLMMLADNWSDSNEVVEVAKGGRE